MPMRVISWLTLLALLFAPLNMLAGPAAAAEAAVPHHASTVGESGHCTESASAPAPAEPSQRAPWGDCLIKCALACSSLPADDSVRLAAPPAAAGGPSAPSARSMNGLGPEAADPPPRKA